MTKTNAQRTADALDRAGTVYGDLTVVDRDNRFEISSEYPLSDQQDIATSGVTHQSNNSVFRIRANNSTESIESVTKLAYSPGYIAEIGIALRIPEAPTGDQDVKWGYWDGDDGVYFGWDADGVYIERQRNGTPQGKIRNADWNGDVVDAVGELTDGTITRLALGLYNFGFIGGEIFESANGTLTPKRVHEITPEGETTLSTQNLPLRVEVDNSNDASDFDVFVSDRQATIRGQFGQSRRLNGELQTDVSLSGTDWQEVVTLRKKDSLSSVTVEIFDLSLLPDDDIVIQFRSDVGSTTDSDYGDPTDVTTIETAIETDTAPGSQSISDGTFVYRTLLGSGQGLNAGLATVDGVDLKLKRQRPLTLFARKVSGTGGTINALTLNWEESW
jgi:hypothetical protein